MKKLLIAIFSLIFCMSISSQKVEALDYNGTLGYKYTASSTRFYYLTDKENVTIKVIVENKYGAVKDEVQLDLDSQNGVYVGTSQQVSLTDRYYFNICDASSNCIDTIDPFSPYLNVDGTRNIVLDISNIESEWGYFATTVVNDVEKSIYALDVAEYVKNIEDPIIVGKSDFSVFDKMVYPSSKGNLLIGPEYLRNLGFTYLEMNGLYDQNNYFAINPLNSTMDDDYSAIKEYQTMIKLYKEYELNVVVKTNFSKVSPLLKNALLNISSTAVSGDTLNFSDPIVKRYIKEVYTRWVKEFKIDGFYIEDAATYGEEYLTSLASSLSGVNSGLFIYSNGGNTTYKANDNMQNLLLGSLNSLDGKGIVNGVYSKDDLKQLNELMFGGYYTSREGYEKASKTINNFGSEKGMDVYSKVEASLGVGANAENIKNTIRMALYTIYSSSGIPRVIAGNEFLNTTSVDAGVDEQYKVCITQSICYALGEHKDINWEYLQSNGNVSKVMGNYRRNYYYQYPSVESMKYATSIELNEEYLDKGVLYIIFTYDAREDGDIERSLYIMNYSFDEVDLSKVSEKEYTSVSTLVGRVREVDGKTKLNGLTFFTFTEVKRVDVPQWLFIVVGIGLVGLIVGVRQWGIYLLKQKKGIDYNAVKKQGKKGLFKREKVDLTKEASIIETFLSEDPLIKEKKEEIKKAKAEKKAKKTAEKEKKKEELKDDNENKNGGN